MELRNIELVNFRNFENLKLNFPKITIIFGDNKEGKTNLLEAIYFFTFGKSFRGVVDQELINWNKDFSRILGIFGGKKVEIEIILTSNFISGVNDKQNFSQQYLKETFISSEARNKVLARGEVLKKIKINGTLKKLRELFGKVNLILFSPTDINIILGSPRLRRRFFDLIILSCDKKYQKLLLDFKKILHSRNKLLFKIKVGRARPCELDFWNQEFFKYAELIFQKRKEIVNFFNQILPANYKYLGGNNDFLEIEYLPNLNKNKEKLNKIQFREIKFGFSLIGPQKDDYRFNLNKKLLADFGSRGELRTAVLAFKLAELRFKERLKIPLFCF